MPIGCSRQVMTPDVNVTLWSSNEERYAATFNVSASPATLGRGSNTTISANYSSTLGAINGATCVLNITLSGDYSPEPPYNKAMTQIANGNYTYNYTTHRTGPHAVYVRCNESSNPTMTGTTSFNATGEWFDTYLNYSKNYTVTNSLPFALTEYQVNFTVDTASLIAAGTMSSNCSDIRVAGSGGVAMSFWIEEWTCNNIKTNIYTKVPVIPASGSTTFSMYYGGYTAGSSSNGDNTFLFFDDFNGTSLNTSKWSTSSFVLENSGPYASLSTGYNTPTVDGFGNLSFTGTRSATDSALEDGVNSGYWGRSVIGRKNISEENFTTEAKFMFNESSTGSYNRNYAEFALGVGTNKDNYIIGYQANETSGYLRQSREASGTHTYSIVTPSTPVINTWKRVIYSFINGNTAVNYTAYKIDGSSSVYNPGQTQLQKNVSIGFAHRAPSASVTQKVDWILVRKYAFTEPIVTKQAGEACSVDSDCGSVPCRMTPNGYKYCAQDNTSCVMELKGLIVQNASTGQFPSDKSNARWEGLRCENGWWSKDPYKSDSNHTYMEYTFSSTGSNASAKIKIPVNATVTKARVWVTGKKYNGNEPAVPP